MTQTQSFSVHGVDMRPTTFPLPQKAQAALLDITTRITVSTHQATKEGRAWRKQLDKMEEAAA